MVPGRRYNVRFALRMLRRHWWMLAVPFAITSSLAVTFARTLPDVYYAQSGIEVIPPRLPANYVKGTVQVSLLERLQTASQQVLTAQRLEPLIDEFDVYPTVRGRVPKEALTTWFRSSIRLEPVKGNLFTVGYYGYSRTRTLKIAQRLTTMVIQEMSQQRETLADNTGQFLDTELESARKRLEAQEERVADYRRRYAGQLPTEVETNLRLMQTTSTELQGIEEALNQDRARRDALSNELQAVTAASADDSTSSDDPQIADPPPGDPTATLPAGPPVKQLRAARALRANLLRRFTPEYPDVQTLDRRIAELEKLVASTPAPPATDSAVHAKQLRDSLKTLDGQIAVREAQAAHLRQTVAGYRDRVDLSPEREAEWMRLTRDYNTLEGVYQELLAKREESRIAANLDKQSVGEQLRIVEQPRLPAAPVSPKRRAIVLIGAGIGAGLGILLLAVGELRDRTIRAEEEVLATLNLPVIGLVPVIVTARDRLRKRRWRLVWSIAAVLLCAGLAVLRWHP